MLNGLGGGEQAVIKRGRSFVFRYDLCAFVSDAHDRRAGLTLRLLFDDREYLFETFDMLLGFSIVLFESLLEFLIAGCFGHFWESVENLLFSKINILERVVEQSIQLFR